ncbi:hypothetical protein N7481_008748 [Penicillium waksmanii]|uniref:uncharacterized protein n=1 Tax=Penicillium waksmanii TaxID=69791 RepID=UPI00254860DA|nr:uncharacterized protein N7481_008748 [Penicillium waksmanii]KAJ5975041.1 hypothetical protein N7481_008748 [Penicillium waksmanii]
MLTRLSLRGSVRSIIRCSSASLTPGYSQAPVQHGFTKAFIARSNRSYCQSSPRFNSPDIKITSEELFRYTEGRWLVGDDLNQELRYVKFDVHELCRRAAEDVGDGTKVIRVDKIPSLNSRVLLLTMDDGKEIIAKIKCPITGPVMMTTISEVTILAFLDGMTSIRGPEVYGLECDEEKLGAEYILMEKMKGVPLTQKWGSMSSLDQMKIIDQVVEMEKELANLKFPAYGSLATPVLSEVDFRTYPLSSSLDPDRHCAIGPCFDSDWWYTRNQDGTQAKIVDSGPWLTLAEYGHAITQRELALIENESTAPEIQRRLESFDKSQSLAEYKDLLKKVQSVIPILSRDQRVLDIAEPILRNDMLGLEDIYVSLEDPTKIEGFIGWRTSKVLPLFVQASLPNFVPLPAFYTYGAHTYSRPDDFDTLSPETKQSVIKELDMASRAKYYELKRCQEIKKMNNPYEVNRKLWRLFEVCAMQGSGSITPLRNRLHQLFENWSALGLPGACPFSVTEAEVQRQRQQEDKLIASLDVEDIVRDKLSTNSVGWIASDQWEEKLKANQELHEDFVQTVSKDIDAESATQMWPFPPNSK